MITQQDHFDAAFYEVNSHIEIQLYERRRQRKINETK